MSLRERSVRSVVLPAREYSAAAVPLLNAVEALHQRGATGIFSTTDAIRPTPEQFRTFEDLLDSYRKALQTADSNPLRGIADGWPNDFFESGQRGLYTDTRPKQWKINEGSIRFRLNRDPDRFMPLGCPRTICGDYCSEIKPVENPPRPLG